MIPQTKSLKYLLYSWMPYLVFFLGTFIYFGFWGGYTFFYQEKTSLFILSKDFLIENLHQPGGLLIYMSKFLSAFFYYNIAGAFIVSAIITLIILSISRIMGFFTGKNARIFPFVIGLLLFWLHTDYRYLLFNSLGIVLQMALFLLVIKNAKVLKGWGAVIIIPFWYFITGGFAWGFLVFMTLYFAFSKEKKGWIKIIALWGISFLTFYISKEFIFFQTTKTLLFHPFTELNTASQPRIFLGIAFILSILPLIALIKIRLPSRLTLTELTESIILTAVIVASLFIIGIRRFDKKVEQYFHVERLFYQGKYDEIITFNRTNPTTNSLTIFLNNIALCETGSLNDMLFSFPQSQEGNTLFLKWEMSGEILRRGGYFYYTIGMVNEAHRWAFENMVMTGLSPENLKMLIKTDLITGNYKVASKYIDILKKTIFYRKEARAFGKFLYNDAAVNANPELGGKKSNSLRSDFFSITDDPFINIERILSADSLNHNAFEYKLAFMLLRKDFKGIASELPKLKALGYTRLPEHIEEAAIALSVLSNKGELTDPGNIPISRNTQLRWNQFLSVFQQYNANPKNAEPALRKEFGKTFWYWAFYH